MDHRIFLNGLYTKKQLLEEIKKIDGVKYLCRVNLYAPMVNSIAKYSNYTPGELVFKRGNYYTSIPSNNEFIVLPSETEDNLTINDWFNWEDAFERVES